MTDRHDFDAWHAREDDTLPAQSAQNDGEVDAREHDLWGFGAAGAPEENVRPPRPPRRSGRPEWFAPVLVIAVAALAFAGTWMLTRGTGGHPEDVPVAVSSAPSTSPSSQPSAPTTSAGSSSDTGTSTPSSSGSSSGASSAPTDSSDTSSASPPADAVATCGAGTPLGDAGVKLAAGTNSSCAYIADAVAKVRAQVAADGDATTFTIAPYSAVLHKVVPLSCTRAQHLTACNGGNNVRFWVAG